VRRAVSRPVCADETNPPLSVDRKLRGASTVGPHTTQPAPAVAPHDPPRQADACRSAIGRTILWQSLVRAEEDSPWLARLREMTRDESPRFHWQRIAERVEQMYADVMA
jgi:hypothetical protein